MADTAISWTNRVWNPTTGCDRVSPGCDSCYALTMAKRLKAMGSVKYQTDGNPGTSGPGFGLATHDDALTLPLRWRKPTKVFVNSMSDLFHDKVPDEFIARVFAVMAATPQHTYQILTKRHARMRSLLSSYQWWTRVVCHAVEYGEPGPTQTQPDGCALPNVWLGVSVENQQWADIRVPALLATPAAVRWLSCEPLLGPVDLSQWVTSVDWPACFDEHSPAAECSRCIRPEWAVVGGESGPGARPMDTAWAQQIVTDCRTAGVPVFVKQMGSRWGRRHHDINLFPVGLRIREYPRARA